MDPFLDSRSLSTTASSSVPHTPSPPMSSVDDAGAIAVGLGYETSSAQYYLDYQTQQPQQLQPGAQPHQHHHHQHQPPPIHLVEGPHHSSQSSSAGSLYRRASFPFVHHDHSLSPYAKYPESAPPVPELPAIAGTPQHTPLHVQEHHHHHHYEFDEGLKMEQSSPATVVVPTQVPSGPHHISQGFYRPSSASSSVSSVSAAPSYLNPVMSNIPVLHTDDAASKETQYLRRKCFNCGTTEPPSWRRSTLNPGKIVCNKCGLYERTHNKPRPHQFGLRPGNKTRKQSLPTLPSHSITGKANGSSPSSSPKRHGLPIKKEPLDYRQAMRRGSIASINSGSGTSDWDDHSGYSTASSAYPPPLGMVPPPSLPLQSHQQQQHSTSHHHVPSHHGHHPYNSALSMPPPRATGSSIRLPQAPPMKIPGRAVGPSSPLTTLAPGIPTVNATGNGALVGSPEGMLASPVVSSTPPQQHLLPTSSYGSAALSQNVGFSAGYGANAPPMLPSDYYARRGSTSQIPPHHVSHYHQEVMRRGSVGAIGMTLTASSPSTAYGPGLPQRHLPPPPWEQQQRQLYTCEAESPVHVSVSDRSLTPTSVVGPTGFGAPNVAIGNGTLSEGHSTSSTPRRDHGASSEYTPSPPHPYLVHPHGGSASASSSPALEQNVTPELATLTV